MSTIYLELPVDTENLIEGLRASEEEDFLLYVLNKFDSNSVNAALREYFGLQKREYLPDFVDADKL